MSLLGIAGLVVIYGLTWLVGLPAARRSLLAFDRSLIRALEDGVDPPPEFRIERFVSKRWVVLPFLLYNEGQSYTQRGPISCNTEKKSLLLWYGLGAVLVWQDKEWFPAMAEGLDGAGAISYQSKAPSNNRLQQSRHGLSEPRC